MKMFMSYRYRLALLIFTQFGWVSPAFAIQGEASNFSAFRHDGGGSQTAQNIRVEGTLQCQMGDANSGQGCALKIQQNQTGHVYNLTENQTAMRFFLDGKKNVAVEGSLQNSNTIEIKVAEAL